MLMILYIVKQLLIIRFSGVKVSWADSDITLPVCVCVCNFVLLASALPVLPHTRFQHGGFGGNILILQLNSNTHKNTTRQSLK